MVIAVCGFKRSGKDTIGKYLVENYGFVRYAFADPIRKVCQIIFDWTDDDMELRKEVIDPYWGISPRFAMQWIGTEAFQYYLPQDAPDFSKLIGRCIWIKKFIRWKERTKNDNVVITDMRFHHELSILKKSFGDDVKSIRVIRNSIESSDPHASEQDIPDLCVDYEIGNNNTIEMLYKNLDDLMSSLKIKPVWRGILP